MNVTGATAARHVIHRRHAERMEKNKDAFLVGFAATQKKDGANPDKAASLTPEVDAKALYEQMRSTTTSLAASQSNCGDDAVNNTAIWQKATGASLFGGSRVPNVASKGDQTLTEEQIARLRDKYDINNLSKEDRYNLLNDLMDMEVITFDEALSTVFHKIPDAFMVEVKEGDPNFRDIDSSNLVEWLTQAIAKSRFYFGAILEQQGKNHTSLLSVESNHQKLLEVLGQLV